MIDTQHIARRLAVLAMDPAFEEITRHTTKQIKQLHPDQFKTLGRDVAEQIAFLKEQQKIGESNEDAHRATN
jgi:hypothetical protein